MRLRPAGVGRSSMPQLTTVVPGPATSMKTRVCGLAQTNAVTVPVSCFVVFASYAALEPWCAAAAPDVSKSPAIAAQVRMVRVTQPPSRMMLAGSRVVKRTGDRRHDLVASPGSVRATLLARAGLPCRAAASDVSRGDERHHHVSNDV